MKEKEERMMGHKGRGGKGEEEKERGRKKEAGV